MERNNLTAGKFFGNLGKAICYLFLFLACQLITSAVYTITVQIYVMLNPGSGIDPVELVLSCTDQISLISGLATLILLNAFFLLRRKNPLKEAGFHLARGRYVFLAFGMAPVLYVLVTLVLGLLPEQWMEAYQEASASLNQTGILIMLSTVILAPIVEEIIFRGLVLSRLNRVMPGWLSVLLSALLFGVCHGQAVWMAYAFVMGVIFGFLTLASRSIWPSLIAHLIFNGIGQLCILLEERTVDPWPTLLILGGAGFILSIATLIFMLAHPQKRSSVA